MNRRSRLTLGLGVSALLLVGALLLPTAWYDALPRSRSIGPLPVRGTAVLQVLLTIQALCIATIMLVGGRWFPPSGAARSGEFALRTDPDDLARPQALRWLALITILALALRVHGIGADLWIDELITLARFAHQPFAEIIGSYRTANNHLLISLLMKASITAFGEHEWSVRLAAVAFGVATIPALYGVSRLAMSRRASLAAALLLAVSYHHVFFSQNARGYGAYMLFALLGTRALIDALRDDRPVQWLQYGAAILLGFMVLLNTIFVVAAQLLVVAIVLVRMHRRGAPIHPLLVRAGTVFLVTGYTCLEVFAIALPEAYLVITTGYGRPSSGFSPASSALLLDVLRGITDGFGMREWVAAVPFLALAGAGLLVLWRRQWAVAVMLLFPGVFTAALLLARGFTFSPRFFLLWLPLAVLTAAVTIDALAQRQRNWSATRRHTIMVTVAGALAVVSVLSLRHYYAVPKQPYVATLRHVEHVRHVDDLVYVIHPAHWGVRYYGERLHIPLARDYAFIPDVETLDSALALRDRRGVLLITTLERGLTASQPALMARLEADWKRDTTFDATIGDGQLSVWSERATAPLPQRQRSRYPQ